MKGAWLEPELALLRRDVKENWTEGASQCGQEDLLGKEVGRKRDYSIFAGRMLVNVKHANWGKAQKSTGCTTVQNGTKSGVRFGRPSESVSKRRGGVAKKYRREALAVKRYRREQRKFHNEDLGVRKAP